MDIKTGNRMRPLLAGWKNDRWQEFLNSSSPVTKLRVGLVSSDTFRRDVEKMALHHPDEEVMVLLSHNGPWDVDNPNYPFPTLFKKACCYLVNRYHNVCIFAVRAAKSKKTGHYGLKLARLGFKRRKRVW